MTADEHHVEIVVAPDEVGLRLDQILASRSGIPRSRLDAAAVTVDGAVARLRDRPGEGAVVRAEVTDPAAAAARPEGSVAVDVVWADDDVIVVDKPAGLAVHPPAGDPARGGTLVSGLLDRFPEIAALADDTCRERPGIVHRIDRGTSGLLVVARTPAALASLRRQIADHSTDRVYAVLVAGEFESTSGAVDAPIGRRSGHRTMSVTADGRPSVSRYRVEAAWDRPEVTAVSVELETGRTHQIRVHMRAIGHPVVGDRPYGGRMLLGATRQVLHAHRLAFTHPSTGERCSFVSPLPEDLRGVFDRVGVPVSGAVPPAWTASGGARRESDV